MPTSDFGISRIAIAVSLGCILVACDSDNNSSNSTQGDALSLSILHINDHHSHLEPDSVDFEINGQETEFEMGGFPRVVSKFNELQGSLEAEDRSVLKLHAGDAITGTLYYTLYEGEADAALMNQVCFDAFVTGNHEFDSGDAGLKTFLDYLNSELCETPVLAANVLPEVGVSPLAENAADDYLIPYAIKDFGGEQVGIIGIDIKQKTEMSSNPDETTRFLDEVETAQRYIDELAEQNVNKIILLTHIGYENDLAMARELSGVDVIVGGDSHSLLGSSFDELGLESVGPYPTTVESADGHTVCVAQAWQYSNVVGELHVEFDASGTVQSCSGTPHLLLGGEPVRDDQSLTGVALQEALDFVDASPVLSIVATDAVSQALLDGFSEEVEELKLQVIGQVAEDLCLSRIPGDSRSTIPGCSALTAERGGHIQQVVAQAFRDQVGGAEIGLQNAGGVRIDIPEGEFTIADAFELLPFSNTMVLLEMTGSEILDTLEEAVANFLDEGGSTGSYPYASGLRWDLDLTQPFGSRFSNVQVQLPGEDQWSAIDVGATYVVSTNDFIARGQDGYLTLGTVTDDGRVTDTYLEYAQTFVDYVKAVGVLTRPVIDDFSTQNFIPASE